MVQITANDIRTWAEVRSRDCQERMPELVRRLVRASCPRAARVDFPAGDSVLIGGWDGLVDSPEACVNVPGGSSGWEIGASRDIKSKADADYSKRTEAPGEVFKAESTFVFVTPRRWNSKRRWERDRNANGEWREVRVLDADDLEQWLEQCPAVELWLARHLDIPQAEHETLEQFWEAWASATAPIMARTLLTAGRGEAQRALLSKLNGPPGLLTIAADTEQEAAAFVYAALAEALDAGQRHLDRAVVLNPRGDVARFIDADTPLVLVAMDLDMLQKHAGRAVNRGHHVIVATARQVGMKTGALDLPRVPRNAFREVLLEAGFPDEEIDAIAWQTGRSLSALRRRRAMEPLLHRPNWASAENAHDLLPALLDHMFAP